MSADDRHRETMDLLAEVALGVADGEERARLLEHVDECADCRRELERHSAVADGLLTLAPEEEPPPGFELGVLNAIHPPVARRRSILRPLAFVATVAAAVAITATALLVSSREDRRLADSYRATLQQANGKYFRAVPLADAAGRRAGVLFAYRGAPSWILVTVAPQHRGSVEQAELIGRDGRVLPLASFRLSDGAWGGSIPVDLREVAAVHLLGGDGRAILVAALS
jgi:Putative zinc-finger